jgi:nucleotide-binding universal stress UspA family protein
MLNVRKILCPLAGTEESPFVIDTAVTLARKFQAQLTVLNVIPLSVVDMMRPYGSMVTEDVLPKQVEERLEVHSQAVLAKAREQLDGYEAELTSIIGHPGEAICHIASEGGYDLIVIGNRAQNALQRLFLGSVSDYVVHNGSCPVMIARCREA